MMLIAVLLLSLGVPPGQDPDARTQAERLARSGDHAEAMKRFQALAAANPDDVAARLWIGRLHLWMGHPHRAAAVFESVLATSNNNIEALTGFGLALIEAGDLQAAADALNRAEALGSDRVDVLAAQGRLHAADGRGDLALAYYDRAMAAEPANAAVKAEAALVRAARAHRVDAGYDFQSFDPSSSTLHSGHVAANLRISNSVRVVLRGEGLRHNRDVLAGAELFAELAELGLTTPSASDSRNEARGGAGVEWTLNPDVHLRGGAQFGNDTTWLPQVDSFVHATFGSGRTRWTFRTHYFDFDEADLWIGGPGIAIDLSSRATVIAEYWRGRTGTDGGSSQITDNAVLGLHGKVSRTTTAFIEYHRGLDRLEMFTVDRLAANEANTLSLGAALELTPFVGLSARYDFQERSGGRHVHRAGTVFTFRF